MEELFYDKPIEYIIIPDTLCKLEVFKAHNIFTFKIPYFVSSW